MSVEYLTEGIDQIVASRMEGQMHLNMVQHRQGLHEIFGNGSCIATKPMEMDINED